MACRAFCAINAPEPAQQQGNHVPFLFDYCFLLRPPGPCAKTPAALLESLPTNEAHKRVRLTAALKRGSEYDL